MVNQGVHSFPRLGLGEAKGLFGLTGRALRYYEDLGLIEAHRDRNNTRYYDLTARRRLGWIAPLRQVGAPLADIARLLDGPPESLRERASALVEARLRALAEDVARAQAVLEAIHASQDHPPARLALAGGSAPVEKARRAR